MNGRNEFSSNKAEDIAGERLLLGTFFFWRFIMSLFTDTYTVSFFGHREIDRIFEVEERIYEIVCDLLRTKEYVVFLVGRDGEFDQRAAAAVRRAKRNIREDNSELTWVMAYPMAEYRNNQKEYEDFYDNIELCEASAKAHPKSAIQIRNRDMIDRSDLVICYIDHKSGGAYQSVRYALKKQKVVSNLGRERSCY